MQKLKYITNRDLLSEIHRSKNSYCSFVSDEHANYDAIVGSVEEITPELIEQTRAKRAALLMQQERQRQKDAGVRNYAITVPQIAPSDIPLTDLVFRVMTYEHVPLDPDRKRKNRNTNQSYARTNFPPFKHYVIEANTDPPKLKEVGRSHWTGGLSNGYFDVQGGRMSPRLASMFMMLVERYSRRGNWRGYTYVDEMRSHALLQLSQIGLQFDESKSDNPFAFYTTAIKNCLAGETEILTREHGVVKIEEVANQRVTLLDGNGDWIACHIYDRGVQETQLTYFQGGNQRIGIWSTLEHGWVSDGEIVETQDFAGRNTKIDDLRPLKTIKDEDSYRRGVLHGLVYGDGSKIGNTSYILRVCSHHASIEPWLSTHAKTTPPSAGGDPVYFLKGIKTNLKEFPEAPGRDLDYLLGFLRGWFAADGCVSKVPTPTLCGDLREYNWLKKWGPLAGWHVNSYTKLAETTNFGKRIKQSLNIHLRKSSMHATDFLIEQHRVRWLTRPVTRRGADVGRKYNWPEIEKMRESGLMWKDIAKTLNTNKNALCSSYSQYRKFKSTISHAHEWHVYGSRQDPRRRRERVYCPIVPTTHTFALACGIHTKQCFTRILNLERKNQIIRDDVLIMNGAPPSYTRQIREELDTIAARDEDVDKRLT